MPEFYLSQRQITQMVNALLAGVAGTGFDLIETPLVVHFEEGNRRNRENVFEEHCSGCHRSLTRQFGGLGRGRIGPNLSGLLSPFYPKNYGEKEVWTSSDLKKWLQNPREIRVNAQMSPVPLGDDEFARLLGLIF